MNADIINRNNRQTHHIMKHISYILLLFAALFLPALSGAQTIKELEAKKKKALQELAVTNKLLNETQKNKKGTENKISLLQRSIRKSNEYINALNSEISLLDRNIDSLKVQKDDAERRLERHRQEYARMIQASYFQRKYFSPLLFILSADNFSQAIRRFRYMQEMAGFRRQQAEEIMSLTSQIAAQEGQLLNDRMQKETAMSAKELESQRLERQTVQQREQLKALKRKESSLKQKQKKQQQQADQLNSRIQKLIAEEIKRQNADKSQGGKAMNREEKLVAGNFEKNKGKLPLPVEKGFISGHYGIQPHPFLDKVQVNNKGTYIQTPAGSDARAIFEGEVTQCFSVPGSNNSVIIKHGNYRTVYSNLTTLYVKAGDKVSTKQRIGKVFTDKENDNKTELYIMVYKDTEIQNPESWLAL